VAATRPDDLVAVRVFSQSWIEIRLLTGSMVSFLRPGHLMMVCGLRVADVDFMRGVISPAVQYPAEELKTEISKTSIPIPASLALELAAHLQQHPGETLLTSPRGQLEPWRLERAIRTARGQGGRPPGRLPVPRPAALPRVAPDRQGRRREDRARPAAARLGQDHARHTYGHLWPDQDESTRVAVDAVLQDRAD
jgi:hypothetical protein